MILSWKRSRPVYHSLLINVKIGNPDWTGDRAGTMGDFEILIGEAGDAWVDGSDKLGDGWTDSFDDKGDSNGLKIFEIFILKFLLKTFIVKFLITTLLFLIINISIIFILIDFITN